MAGVPAAQAGPGPTAPGVTTQPSNTQVGAGHEVRFFARSSGNPTPSVQWQVSTDGITYVDVPGPGFFVTIKSLRFKATGADDGNRYQAVYSNVSGTVTTTTATLTVSFRRCRAKSHAHINLSGCDRVDADFSGANLTNARLNDTDLNGAQLLSATLTGASITGAILSDANLTGANLTDANLTGSRLSGASLGGVRWNDTTCPDGTNSDTEGNTCVHNL
jgi:hypothetical protein